MKNAKIVFVRCLEKEKVQTNEQERSNVISYFKWLASEHPNDNVISHKMLEILPEVDEITIPVDDLNTNIPFILYRINGDTKVLSIPRNHKICWAKLKEFAARI